MQMTYRMFPQISASNRGLIKASKPIRKRVVN